MCWLRGVGQSGDSHTAGSQCRRGRRGWGNFNRLNAIRAIRVKNHVQRTEAERLAALQRGFLDFGAIDERTVGGSHVLDEGRAVLDHDLAVGAGDAGVFEFEIVAGAPAKKVYSGLELDLPSLGRPRI